MFVSLLLVVIPSPKTFIASLPCLCGVLSTGESNSWQRSVFFILRTELA